MKGLPIDEADRLAAITGDELVPVSHGGSGHDRTNCRLAHRHCNGVRCALPVTPALRARCHADMVTITTTGVVVNAAANVTSFDLGTFDEVGVIETSPDFACRPPAPAFSSESYAGCPSTNCCATAGRPRASGWTRSRLPAPCWKRWTP